MRIFYLFMFFTFLSVGLFGCQESSSDNHDNKVEFENYDVAGIVTEVNDKANRVLVKLTNKVQENEEQMWIAVEKNTKIFNEKKEAWSFQDIKPQVRLKAYLNNECLEPNPRICFAKEIIIE